VDFSWTGVGGSGHMKVWFKFLFISGTVDCDATFRDVGIAAQVVMNVDSN